LQTAVTFLVNAMHSRSVSQPDATHFPSVQRLSAEHCVSLVQGGAQTLLAQTNPPVHCESSVHWTHWPLTHWPMPQSVLVEQWLLHVPLSHEYFEPVHMQSVWYSWQAV